MMERRPRPRKGATTSAFSGPKKVKGDKAVVFRDRDYNVIAPLVAAVGNRNESPLLRQALPQLTKIARALGLDLQDSIVNLDVVYDRPLNRKAIFNRGMLPNIVSRAESPISKGKFLSSLFLSVRVPVSITGARILSFAFADVAGSGFRLHAVKYDPKLALQQNGETEK